MDLDSIAAELYSGPREEFTGRRNELAARARKAGDRDLAARIKELRKPTSSAWLANRLAAAHPDELGELTELGESLRQAHRELASDDIRELSHRRREQINQLLGLAREVARAEGVSMSETITREIESTLEAAVAGEEAAEQLAAGRLSAALTPDMTDMWLMAASPSAAPARQAKPEKPKAEKKKKPEPVRDELAAKRAEAERRRREERRQAEERAKRTAADRDAAAQELSELESEAEDLGKRVENLETELAKLKQKHREVRKAVAAAEKTLEKAKGAAGAAERALSSLPGQ
ncbi:hypothetical protein [Amycolatopsis albispora]|nr:hypothetical protein [Amycolatopsis albispora]